MIGQESLRAHLGAIIDIPTLKPNKWHTDNEPDFPFPYSDFLGGGGGGKGEGGGGREGGR